MSELIHYSPIFVYDEGTESAGNEFVFLHPDFFFEDKTAALSVGLTEGAIYHVSYGISWTGRVQEIRNGKMTAVQAAIQFKAGKENVAIVGGPAFEEGTKNDRQRDNDL